MTQNGVTYRQTHPCIVKDISMAWVELPDLIFVEVMMKVGLESLEGLQRCRQVCKAWNNLILRDIYQSENKRKIIRERIERNWGPGMFPSDDEISNAKWAGKGCLMLKFNTNIIHV